MPSGSQETVVARDARREYVRGLIAEHSRLKIVQFGTHGACSSFVKDTWPRAFVEDIRALLRGIGSNVDVSEITSEKQLHGRL